MDNLILKIIGIPRCIHSLYLAVLLDIQEGGVDHDIFTMKTKSFFKIIYEAHQHHI